MVRRAGADWIAELLQGSEGRSGRVWQIGGARRARNRLGPTVQRGEDRAARFAHAQRVPDVRAAHEELSGIPADRELQALEAGDPTAEGKFGLGVSDLEC